MTCYLADFKASQIKNSFNLHLHVRQKKVILYRSEDGITKTKQIKNVIKFKINFIL